MIKRSHGASVQEEEEEEGRRRRKKEEGRRKKEEGRRKKEEEEGRRRKKKEEEEEEGMTLFEPFVTGGNARGEEVLALFRKKWRKIGLKGIAMWPGRFSWKVDGRKRDYSMWIGRISVNVKLARREKAQKNTGSTTAQNGTKSDERFQRFSGSWSKKQEPQRRSGSGTEVLLNILSVEVNGTGTISL